MARKSMKDRIGQFAAEASVGKEGTALVMLNTRVSKKLLKTLKLHVVKNDMTMNRFVVEAIERELRRQGAAGLGD